MLYVDILKKGELADSEEKKEAIKYLEEALNKKNEYIETLVADLGPQVGKDALIERVKESFFKTYKMRLNITGRKIVLPEEGIE